MNNILAIDPSISSAGICYNGEVEVAKTKPSQHRFERIDEVVCHIDVFLDTQPIDYVVMEQYAFNMRNTSTLTDLAELGGCIKMKLYKRNIEPFIVSAKRWKAMVFNNASIQKDMTLKEVYKRFGRDCKNSDEADAFGIYKFLDIVINYLKNPEMKFKYHENVMHIILFDLIRRSGILDVIKVPNRKNKIVREYYYKGKKVSSFKGVTRYIKREDSFKTALTQFNSMYKIKEAR